LFLLAQANDTFTHLLFNFSSGTELGAEIRVALIFTASHCPVVGISQSFVNFGTDFGTTVGLRLIMHTTSAIRHFSIDFGTAIRPCFRLHLAFPISNITFCDFRSNISIYILNDFTFSFYVNLGTDLGTEVRPASLIDRFLVSILYVAFGGWISPSEACAREQLGVGHRSRTSGSHRCALLDLGDESCREDTRSVVAGTRFHYAHVASNP
ncbi:hypothetical protein A4X13_0g3140, partial [Tilletia indica]